jgi:lysophospholipase L1-like esterase
LFSNEPAIAVSPGALVLSDPVDLEIPALADVAVSLYFPNISTAHTSHIVADLTSFIAKSNGNFTEAVDLPGASLTGEWDFLAGVDVSSDSSAAIVILGYSITDGIGTTPDTNGRWSDLLAKRLQASGDLKALGVLNEALTGDRVRYPGPQGLEWFGPAALARFDRDVLAQAGARYLIVLMGINDFAQPGVVAPTSEEASISELIAGHLQLIRRAHEKGIVTYGCTLTPFKESLIGPGFYTPEKEAKREEFNEWIRTSGAYDAVIDFDKVLRDPANPIQMLPAYDSGDHTHPNDAGNRAMANAVDISLFRCDHRP